jgi:flavin-dependent dehydrogenase
MTTSREITIVGGGLAGLALGIALRKRAVPVTVFEAGHYPRHRVCGEFINGRGRLTLTQLGLDDDLRDAGAAPATTSAFFLGQKMSRVRKLPEPALCISRYALDDCLARAFRAAGGCLRERKRWRGQDSEGTVHATGRRVRPTENGWRLFGLKIHARNVTLAAGLEMHFLPNGYVGLCTLGDGKVNACGLFRRSVSSGSSSQNWREMIVGSPGSLLHERLKNAVFDKESFTSVAGLTLCPERAADTAECRIGDAITMIPPVTGNGMSMAFESAEIAAGPLADFSHGRCGWIEARCRIAAACDVRFKRRLAWARLLQWFMFHPVAQGWAGAAAINSDWLFRVFFRGTR